MKTKLACIVGAGDMFGKIPIIPENAFVIAADGGLQVLERAGISPDLIVGDYDSLGEVPKGENVLSSSPEKDDTDMLLAVKKALELGVEEILIYGGLGGRFEHSIANLQTLAYIANQGARGFLVGEHSMSTVIKNGKKEFGTENRGYLSVFAMCGKAEGVNLIGLKYPLKDHTLTGDFPLGVSNEFLGKPACVSVKEGLLAVIWDNK